MTRDWLNNPRYARARNRLVNRFRASVNSTATLKPVIFLCGGYLSVRRNRVRDYIKKFFPRFHVFYADDVWEYLANQKSENALTLEGELADFAELVIVIVESPGTMAELGAFAYDDKLRSKLLPILDVQHKSATSFINTGPVALVDQESSFAPCIHTDLDLILEAAGELKERLERIRPRTVRRSPTPHESAKDQLLLLSDVLSVIGPASAPHCRYYLREILGNEPRWDTHRLLAFGHALGLFDRHPRQRGWELWTRPLQEGELVSHENTRIMGLVAERARHLEVVLSIPEAREALSMLLSHVAA